MEEKSVCELTREFFDYYPDYVLCRTLAINIKNNIITYHNAVGMLAKKASAAEQNRNRIEEKLNRRTVRVNNQLTPIKNLTLGQIMRQEDRVIKEIVDFYFKHPYAHGRTRRTRFLPRWGRTLFLSTLLGHAKRRGIQLDYTDYFEILRLL